METLYEHIAKNPLAIVMRDAEFACGFDFSRKGLTLITNATAVGFDIAQRHPESVLLIESAVPLDTPDLLTHPESAEWLAGKHIVVFKNTARIERICTERGWTLLNPSATLAQSIEEKASQARTLGELATLLPPHQSAPLESIVWEGAPFILQYNHAHSGEGTLLIESEDTLATLQKKFPKREVRVSAYIRGAVFTSNAVVGSAAIQHGAISYQITGLAPHTDLPFATIGNDWSFAKKLLSPDDIRDYNAIAEKVGTKLRSLGWRGLFGIDVVRDEQSRKFFLIEINARQPASASYESLLQHENTILESHLAALLNLPDISPAPTSGGAQLIARTTHTNQHEYPDKKHNALFARIQVRESIMEASGVLKECYRSAVTQHVLGARARSVIDAYARLPIGTSRIHTPYFNNRRAGLRGGLTVAVGKGSPEELKEEIKVRIRAKGISLHAETEALRRFIVDEGLGVDCSGFVYHVLSAQHTLHLTFPNVRGIIRKLRTYLHPARSTSVAVLADDHNSTTLSLPDVVPGDIITMTHEDLEEQKHDHVLIVTKVLSLGGVPHTLHYAHSVRWQSDGNYNHGTHFGKIIVTHPNAKITEQTWVENGCINETNPTYTRAMKAVTEVRRMH